MLGKRFEQNMDKIVDTLDHIIRWVCVATLMALLAVGLYTCTDTPAYAQGARCMPRAQLVERLSKRLNEHRIWVGRLEHGKAIMELFHNAETRSWTAFSTDTMGRSCYAGSGDGSMLFRKALPATWN